MKTKPNQAGDCDYYHVCPHKCDGKCKMYYEKRKMHIFTYEDGSATPLGAILALIAFIGLIYLAYYLQN